jgi:adenylate cyclase, class 2
MKEIEVKILEINKNKIIAKLKKMGAKKSFDGVIQGEYFDYSDNRLDKNKELLRLRNAGKKVFLTYKKKQKKGKVKCCEEKEIEVSDYDTLKEILIQIGLKVKNETMKKHRASYALEKTHFEIETPLEKYSFIPPFMEIESTSAKTIYEYAKLLGYSEKDCLNWSGNGVIKFYKKKK